MPGKDGKNVPVLPHTADSLIKLEVGGDQPPILLARETLKRLVDPSSRRANPACGGNRIAPRVAVFKAGQMHDVRFEAVCIQVLVDGRADGSRRGRIPQRIGARVKIAMQNRLGCARSKHKVRLSP